MRSYPIGVALLAYSAQWRPVASNSANSDDATMQVRVHEKEQYAHWYLRRHLAYEDTSSSATTTDMQEIVNGQGAAVVQFPWYVELLAYPANGDQSLVRRCGGAMLSGDLVITAANCLYDRNGVFADRLQSVAIVKRETTVALGLGYYRTWKIVRPHPDHVYPSLSFNVAVIQLSLPAFFPTYEIGSIIGDVSEPVNGSTVTGMGYGSSLRGTSLATTLQFSNFTVINRNAACTIPNTTEFFCLGTASISTKVADFCYGDEGAPIVRGPNGFQSLYGIYTGSPQSCANVSTRQNAVVTRVAFHQTWILETACNMGNARCLASCSLLSAVSGFAANSLRTVGVFFGGMWHFLAGSSRQGDADEYDGGRI